MAKRRQKRALVKLGQRKAKRKIGRDETIVRQYRHFDEMYDCFASGWSPQAIYDYVIERWGADGVPSIRSLQRWRNKHMPEAAIVPHRLIVEKLKGVSYKVDIIKHLSRLIYILEDRVARGISQETNFDNMPLAVNDTAVQTYLSALRDWLKAAQDLGLVRAPAMPNQIYDMRQQNLVITPETAQYLKETVKEIAAARVQIEGGGA